MFFYFWTSQNDNSRLIYCIEKQLQLKYVKLTYYTLFQLNLIVSIGIR